MDDEKREGRVHVIDRRHFTAEGDLRDEVNSRPPSPRPAEAPTADPGPEPESEVPAAGLSSPDRPGFLDLVDFLAQQVVLLVSGKVPGHGPDLEAARYFIDLLAVVEEKTSGQLSAEEKRYLEDVLFQLRTLFVASTR